MIDDLRSPDTFDTRLGERASANVTPCAVMFDGPLRATGFCSQTLGDTFVHFPEVQMKLLKKNMKKSSSKLSTIFQLHAQNIQVCLVKLLRFEALTCQILTAPPQLVQLTVVWETVSFEK